MEAGCIVRTIRDFLTIADGELCVKAGEYLQVVGTGDRLWVKCRTATREGLVPTSHVTPEDVGVIHDGEEIFVVENEFRAEQEGDLTLPRGTLVVGKEQIDDAWMRGRTLDGFVGIFPPSYCWRLNSESYRKSTNKQRVEKFAKVVHAMRAQLNEELDLAEGDIVKIIEIIDKDWYRGESNGKTGIFPSAFVKVVDAFPGSAPPETADIKPYLNASKHRGNEYMNTRNEFGDLEKDLRTIGQQSILKSVIEGFPSLSDEPSQSSNQKTEDQTQTAVGDILEDDYFRRNLPASYGCSSLDMEAPDYGDYNAEQSMFGESTERCSKGFQELSRSLAELGGRTRYSAGLSSIVPAADYSKLDQNLNVLRFSTPSEDVPKPTKGILPSNVDYNRITENLKVFSTGPKSSELTTLDQKHSTHTADQFATGSGFGSGLDPLESADDHLRYNNLEYSGYTENAVHVRPYAITKFNFVAEFSNELGFSAGEMVYLDRYVDSDWLEGEIDSQKGMFPVKYVNIIVDCNKTEDDSSPFNGTASVTVSDDLVPDTFHKVLYNFHAQMEGDITVAEGEVVRFVEKENENWSRVENSQGEVGVMPTSYLDRNSEFDGKVQFDIERLLSYKSEKSHQELKRDLTQPTNTSTRPDLKFFDPLCSPDGDMAEAERLLEKKARQPWILRRPDNSVTVRRLASATGKKPALTPKPPRDIESMISSNLSKLPSGSPSLVRAHDRRVEMSSLVLAELRGQRVVPPRPPSPVNTTEPVTRKTETRNNEVQNVPPRKSPAPARPPAPKLVRQVTAPSVLSLTDRSAQELSSEEPTYSQVQKRHKRVDPDSLSERSASEEPDEDSRPPLEPPPMPPPCCPPSPPARPPPIEPLTSLPECDQNMEASTHRKNTIQVCAMVHSYDTPANDVEETPTNPEAPSTADEAWPSAPPLRSSSMWTSRGTLVSRGEVFHASIHRRDLCPPPLFPPDKKSPMSPPAAAHPPSVATLPCRSASVTSTAVKSRSGFYAAAPSERGYSPVASSLNHSYETLNVSEGYDETTPQTEPTQPQALHRQPHRPAPPVPVNEQFEASKQKLFGNKDLKRLAMMTRTTSVTRYHVSKKNLRYRKIHSLKRQIQIKEKMLEDLLLEKEQLLRELDMYQEIAVARGQEYDQLNHRMDHCQANIEKLSDEIQRLQACLSDEELKLEEASLEECRRREEEDRMRQSSQVRKKEDEVRMKELRKQKNREQRSNVIGELIATEREFCRDMKLTWQAFALDTPELLEDRGVDVATLFKNLKDVIEVSESFLESLQEEAKDKKVEDQMVGKCFMAHADHMKKAYTEYCVDTDKTDQLLDQYQQSQNAEVHRLLQKGVETLQVQVACFSMGSILIKPVQRILRYPLLLMELIKCTEDDHKDKNDLVKAANIMADVASFINEEKRKKDIVDKYRNEEKTLTRKITKLNMHSINKKSSRISQKFLSTIGMESMSRDYDFDELDRRFSYLSRSVQGFAADTHRFREHLHEVAVAQFNIAENVADLYKERVHTREVERFRNSHRMIISTYWNEYSKMFDVRVTKPLQMLLEAFQGPVKLIQKRQDKFLDYSASLQRCEKNKDSAKAKALKEHMETTKTTYEALNSQLIEDLPKLIEISTAIYTRSITEFILLRKLFAGRVTRELLDLMTIYRRRLPLLASTCGDILEVFLVKHSLVCGQLGRFSFSSKAFRPEEKKKAGGVGATGAAIGQVTLAPQTSGTRTLLRGKYATARLYQAQEMYTPKDPLDMGVNAGDLVGVIQQKDPLGNRHRWFVDNGHTQGFLPGRILAAVGSMLSEADVAPSATEVKPATHAYDDVPADDDQRKPVRKAPPVPRPPAGAMTSAPRRASEGDIVQHTIEERASHHSYEEIAAATEATSEPSQDLSPIYEEIHGVGSRSTVSTSSGSTSGSGGSSSGAKGRFFYSQYAFTATDSIMLSVGRGQVVRVIQLSDGDWWYVEDRYGNRGYVPHTYLKEYPSQLSSIPVAEDETNNNEEEKLEEK